MKKKGSNRYENCHSEYKVNSYGKKKKGKIRINLESDSDSSESFPKVISPKKINRNNKNKNEENTRLIGNKYKYLDPNSPTKRNIEYENKNKNKKSKNTSEYSPRSPRKMPKSTLISDSNSSSPRLISDSNFKNSSKIGMNEEKKREKINNKSNKKKEEDENELVIFPFEYTERIIDALSCKYCEGIFVRPYVININGCGHIFCLGCILKMLEDKKYGECKECKIQFNESNIKYSEVTDFYIQKFFPQIPNIIEDNKIALNKFMDSEASKFNNANCPEIMKFNIKCQLRPCKENINPYNRLNEIMKHNNSIIIGLKSEKENIVSMIKNQVIKRLDLKNLKEDDIELRLQGIEISEFRSFEMLNKLIPINPRETITFFYSKRGNN